MKKVDKLFIKSFIGPFLLTTTIVVFIFLMRFLMMYFNDFIGKDLGISVFSRLFFYFSLITVPTALPLATLLATLMCFGNMGEHTELTALKSAGIPLGRLVMPTLIFTVFVSLFSLLYNNYVNPWANLKGYSLLWDVKTTKMTLNIQEGVFYKEIPSYRIKVQKKIADGKTMKNIIVYDHSSNNGNKNLTVADSGRMYLAYNDNYLIFELFNGKNYIESQNNINQYNETQFVRNSFKKNKIVFSLESFGIKRTNEDQFKYHEYMKNMSELAKQVDSTEREIAKMDSQQLTQLKSQNTFIFKSPNQPKLGEVLKPGKWINEKTEAASKDYKRTQVIDNALSQIQNLKSSIETDQRIIFSKQKEMWRADVEKWHKITMALSCLVMFLIGASLGSIIKKGGFGMPVLVSISFFIFLYVLMQMGDKYAKEGIIPVIVGVWIPNVILLLIGIFLIRKASNDTRLFENDTYIVWFAKVRSAISRLKNKKPSFT
jgi:lipopolysaccharide export system permease protein